MPTTNEDSAWLAHMLSKEGNPNHREVTGSEMVVSSMSVYNILCMQGCAWLSHLCHVLAEPPDHVTLLMQRPASLPRPRCRPALILICTGMGLCGRACKAQVCLSSRC